MFIIKYTISISILFGYCTGQFDNVTPILTGSNPIECAAIVSQCQGRCRARTEDQGTEYVKFTVYYRSDVTACKTDVTEKNEIVSANPPNSSPTVYSVYNVPCCQQRPFEVITTKNPTSSPETLAPRSVSPPTQSSATKSAKIIYVPIPSITTSSPEEKSDDLSWNDIVLLVVSVLCFILLLIVLTLMVCKIKKKKRGKDLKTDVEASPVTNAVTNGAVLTGVTAGEKIKKEKSANEVLSNVVENIPPPPSQDEENETAGHMTLPKDRKESQDYVVLNTIATTPPKSARSNRPHVLSNKSEEIMIVGRGNRPHGYQNSGIPNGHVGNFYSSGTTTDTTTTASPTIQPQLPGRNQQQKNKLREEALQQRSDVPPENATIENNNEEDETITASIIEGELSQGDLTNPEQHKNIYNFLREESIQDSDYQRLNREDKIQTAKRQDSKNGDDGFAATSNDENTKDITESQTLQSHHILDNEDDNGMGGYGTYFQHPSARSSLKEDKIDSTYKKANGIEMSDYVETPLLPLTISTANDAGDDTVVKYIHTNHTDSLIMSDTKEELTTTDSTENDNLLKESEEL